MKKVVVVFIIMLFFNFSSKMNKADYIVLVGITFFSFYIIWKKKAKKKEINFDKEISDLENAIKIATNSC